MSDALQSAVLQLQSSSKTLNAITDQIGDVVQQAEDFLGVTCSAGVYAFVFVEKKKNPASELTSYRTLEYRRAGSRFRIAVADGVMETPDDEVITAWSECSRAIKLETAKKLPELILEIAKKIDARVEEARKTSAAVSHVMSALNGKEGE